MPRKTETFEEWITSKRASEIMTKNSEHPVSDSYVRRLGLQGKIATKKIDDRTKLYLKRDVDHYIVSTKPGPKRKGEEGEAA